jgi:hypothetical protein
MAKRSGWFEKLDWRGVTDLQQAQYLIRSFLLFASMKVDRAYLYFFDDKDEPQVHGSSGLTRHGKPKPSFYAVSQLYRTLGNYRFERIIKRTEQLYLFEFSKEDKRNQLCWVAWMPTGFRSDQPVQKKPSNNGDHTYRPPCKTHRDFGHANLRTRAKIKTSFRPWSLLLSSSAKAQPIYSSNQKVTSQIDRHYHLITF